MSSQPVILKDVEMEISHVLLVHYLVHRLELTDVKDGQLCDSETIIDLRLGGTSNLKMYNIGMFYKDVGIVVKKLQA